MAITGGHTLFYTTEVDAFREVMRDTFELPIVGERDGVWMAFGLPGATTLEPHGFPRLVEIDLGDRPSHEVCFLCDDLDATIEEMRDKGVEFQDEPKDMGWGIVIVMVLPGGVEAVLCEPREYSGGSDS